MIIIKKISILLLLLSSVFMQECMEFYEIENEMNNFLKNEIAISKKQFKSDDVDEYSDKLFIMKNWLESISCCIDCHDGQKDELRYKLHYQFSKNTMLRYGEMIGYQASLDKSIKFISNIINNLKSDQFNKDKKYCKDEDANEDDCYFIHELYLDKSRFESYLSRLEKNLYKYKSEQDILRNQYKDIEIYIKNKKFDEMLEIRDKDSKTPIIISLDVPLIFYDKKFKDSFTDKELETVNDSTKKIFETQFDRIENLKRLSENFKLTSYDKDKGFYFKIPMVPIVQANRSIGIEHSYAIVINSASKVSKYRFELTSKSERNKPFEGWVIDPMDYNWDFGLKEVPFDWTKIEIDDKNDWVYQDSEGSEICRFEKDKDNPLTLNLAYKEIFIPIYNEEDNKIILYQKDTGDIDGYSLKFLENRRVDLRKTVIKSLKYLMFLLLFGMGYAETV